MLRDMKASMLTSAIDPHSLSDRDLILWVLATAKKLGISRSSYADIAYYLTEIIEIDISRQKVRVELMKLPKGSINYNKKKGVKLMAKGQKIIDESKDGPTAHRINHGTTFTAKNVFVKEIIHKLKGDICICDPYVGARLLDLLVHVDKKSKVKILTTSVEDKPKGIFSRALADIRKEGYQVQVRLFDRSELHDRYVIDSENMWTIGHSIKNLGDKESFISLLGKDIRDSTLSTFNHRWKASEEVN